MPGSNLKVTSEFEQISESAHLQDTPPRSRLSSSNSSKEAYDSFLNNQKTKVEKDIESDVESVEVLSNFDGDDDLTFPQTRIPAGELDSDASSEDMVPQETESDDGFAVSDNSPNSSQWVNADKADGRTGSPHLMTKTHGDSVSPSTNSRYIFENPSISLADSAAHNKPFFTETLSNSTVFEMEPNYETDHHSRSDRTSTNNIVEPSLSPLPDNNTSFVSGDDFFNGDSKKDSSNSSDISLHQETSAFDNSPHFHEESSPSEIRPFMAESISVKSSSDLVGSSPINIEYQTNGGKSIANNPFNNSFNSDNNPFLENNESDTNIFNFPSQPSDTLFPVNGTASETLRSSQPFNGMNSQNTDFSFQ